GPVFGYRICVIDGDGGLAAIGLQRLRQKYLHAGVGNDMLSLGAATEFYRLDVVSAVKIRSGITVPALGERNDEVAAALLRKHILVQLQPNEIQYVGTVIRIFEGQRSRNLVGLVVQVCTDFIVNSVLPVFRPRLSARRPVLRAILAIKKRI